MKITHKNVFAFLAFSFVILLAGYFSNIYISPAKAQTQTPPTNKYLTGYAWSDNIGWISFATSTNGGNLITIDSTGALKNADGTGPGYAWSDNVGWIKFGGLSRFPTSTVTIASDAVYNSSGAITGWARACAGTFDGVCGGGTYTYTPPPVVSTTTGPLVWIQSASAGSRYWRSITSSSDGVKLAAVVGGTNTGGPIYGYIYTSTDSGVTWTERTSAGNRSWQSITSSSDGTKLVAVTNNDYIYTSTDSGATWTAQTSAGNRSWKSITSSSDGTRLAATTYGEYIYTSTDSGATWTQRTSMGRNYWWTITSSSDGTKLSVATWGQYIYTSSDSGATWTTGSPYGPYWISVASDSSGNKLIAADNNSSGYIYTSTNGGANWIQRTSAGAHSWRAVTSSSDGTKLAAIVYGGGYIYLSTDSGATWTAQTSAGSLSGQSITSSSDGNKLAVGTDGYIWTAATSISTTTTPQSPIVSDSRADGWDGWISLSGNGYSVVKNSSNNLSGYAWGSDVLGWIDFSGVSINDVNTSGVCGSSNLQSFSSAPSGSGLCSTGQASSVANPPEYTTYTWSCLGTNGVSDLCHAQRTCNPNTINYMNGTCFNPAVASECPTNGFTFVNGQCVDSRTTCTLDDVKLANNGTSTFYKSRVSNNCTVEGMSATRTCTAGTLDSTNSVYKYKKCVSPKYKEF